VTLKDTESEKIERFEAEKDKKHDYKECIKCHKPGYGLKDYSEYNKSGLISLYQVHPYTLRITNKITGDVRTEYEETRCYIGQGRPLTDMDQRVAQERQMLRKLAGRLSEIDRTQQKLLQEHKIISKEYEDRIKARRNPLLVTCPKLNCKEKGRFTYADKKANRYMVRHSDNIRHYLSSGESDLILKELGREKESLEKIRLTSSTTSTPTTPTTQIPKKRGRGRPRKSESTLIPYLKSKAPQQAPIKRGRGRPRKTDSVTGASLIPKQPQLETPIKRGRGRPRKEEKQKQVESRLEKWKNECNPDRFGLPELVLCQHNKPSKWSLRYAIHTNEKRLKWLNTHNEEPPINITYGHLGETGECSVRLDRKKPLNDQLTPAR
jgi:hypothetical protein